MGGSESKTAVSSLSETISNVAMSTVQNCAVTSAQNQTLRVVNSGIRLWGNYSMEQQTEIRSECFSDVAKQTELQSKIINTIAQATSSSNVALLGAFGSSHSEAIANLTNRVRNNVTMANIQQSYNTIIQNQSAEFDNSGIIVFERGEMIQGAKVFAAATLKEVDKAGIFNDVSNFIDQKSSAKMENPLDFIAKALGAIGDSVMMSIMFFVLIIAMVVLGIGGLIMTLGGSDRRGAGTPVVDPIL